MRHEHKLGRSKKKCGESNYKAKIKMNKKVRILHENMDKLSLITSR